MNRKQREFLLRTMVKGESYKKVSTDLGIDRKHFTIWWEQLKPEREKIAKVRTIWKRKFAANEISYVDFEKWYDEQDKECYYCKTTQREIEQLVDEKLISSKRLATRGRSLEIERLEPDQKYINIANLRMACYWCNNAKSDVFSADEFKPIGAEIGNALRNRLKNGSRE